MKNQVLKYLVGIAAATCAASAFARDNVSLSLSIGAPAYAPAPVYVSPPPPVVYAPPPVVYRPVVPVVRYEETYYGPPGHWHGRDWHEHRHHRGHHD